MSFGYFDQLDEKSLDAIRNHKYIKHGESFLEPTLYHWWTYFLKFVPLTISPNMLTLIGSCILFSSTLLFLYFSRQMTIQVPWWVNIYGAFAMFAYQTFDAIDGMQARRLNAGSPLGEVFDHGCDAFAVLFSMINLGCATRMVGNDYFMYAIWCSFLELYVIHWTNYVTGSFHFSR
ncbi:Cholinephosphotransferase 1 [Thelohanellus kitauei]|uniref:Cholinephosphotransferase 1 n=1 Tax=Thelohanellus kitauei TaxID=669202 RepID=A0A0C2IBS6_THEKT|nr:Cholinephosphotransferase 1 [Thelohanellus kitauei]